MIDAVIGLPQAFALALCRPEINSAQSLKCSRGSETGRRQIFGSGLPICRQPRPPGDGGLAPTNLASFDDNPGLVLNAKFRTRWKVGEMQRTLETLIAQKRYDSEGDRVFCCTLSPERWESRPRRSSGRRIATMAMTRERPPPWHGLACP
ncbi:MAG: hypothetical protein E5X65_20685 [Mesorhizobium sp.]|nr:MAG: hypothetical protein E5X65_20685 [Mesorhizobium sp.]